MLTGLRKKIDGTPAGGEQTTGVEALPLVPQQQLEELISFFKTGFLSRENRLEKNDISFLREFTAQTIADDQLQKLGQFYAKMLTLKESYIQRPRTKDQREHNKVVRDKIYNYLCRFSGRIVFSKESRYLIIVRVYDDFMSGM